MADLLPIYAAIGDDRLMQETVLKRIQTRVGSMGDLDFNSEVFDGASAQGDDIVMSCNTLPFASEKRLVLVKQAEKLNKGSQEALVEYLEAPSETTVLILLTAKLAKNTRLYKAVASFGTQAIIDAAEKSMRELPTRIRDLAVSKGYSMTSEAAEALLQAVGPTMLHLNTELDKLVAFVGADKKEITITDVEKNVAVTSDIKPWDLQDAFSRRDIQTVNDLVSRLFALGQSPHGLLSFCLTRIRELISAATLREHGESPASGAATLGMAPWKAKNIFAWSRLWESSELIAALRQAARIDAEMKSGYDPETAFTVWILSTVSR